MCEHELQALRYAVVVKLAIDSTLAMSKCIGLLVNRGLLRPEESGPEFHEAASRHTQFMAAYHALKTNRLDVEVMGFSVTPKGGAHA